eukprot:TRINITY_DN87957_c3_g1_i1.p1 TRINITY_DN87957_c3_g1~~TRINITY_DN87957_c3_g1_i1.p1  ORF type:complete len:1180 (-),score=137.77 TRINITY_DN87957_c3_g1_i1:4950-8489(-)
MGQSTNKYLLSAIVSWGLGGIIRVSGFWYCLLAVNLFLCQIAAVITDLPSSMCGLAASTLFTHLGSLYVTKPKPRDFPVTLSTISAQSVTSPKASKQRLKLSMKGFQIMNSPCVVFMESPPINIFLLMLYARNTQGLRLLNCQPLILICYIILYGRLCYLLCFIQTLCSHTFTDTAVYMSNNQYSKTHAESFKNQISIAFNEEIKVKSKKKPQCHIPIIMTMRRILSLQDLLLPGPVASIHSSGLPNEILSVLRICQSTIGTERGSARPEEELSFRSRPSPYTEKEREPMVSTARGFQQRRESEDQQAYAPKAESISYIRVFLRTQPQQPYEAYELDFKTQLSTAKDSLVYMQKKIESEIENKLSAKDRDWENLKVQMKASKDSNEALSAQLERASRYQQTRIDDIGKKTDDLSLRLYDFATKKEVKAAEDRINSSIESRISNALRDFSQTIADLQRVTAGNRRELDDEIAELRRRLRDAERQQEEKELKQQTYVDDRLREAQTETRKNAKTAQDALGKLREDMEGKLDLHANNIVNTIRQEHTEHFNEYNEILANYQEAIKNNSTAIDRKAEAAEKEVLLNKERYERLQKEKAELEQQVEALRKNQEVFSQNVEAMLEKKIQEYDQGKAAEREEKEKVWDEQLKEHSQAQEEFKVAVDELKEKVATLEQAHKQAEEGEENKARESENEEKIAALQKELEEVNAKVESIMPLLGDEETQKKLAELDTKLKTIEEELTKRQEQFQKYDAQMQEYEERYQNIEVKYRESIEILNEKCTNIEEGANTRFGEVEKVSAENRDKLAGIGTNLQQLQESHRRLAARVDFLEKKLNVLRVEIQQKLAECAKEFKVHRDAIRELSEQRPSVAKTVENVGVNVVMGEKQMNTVMTGTDNVAYEVEVQTEYQSPPKVPIATEAKEEYKSAVETILAQDYNEPVLKQSSAIFNEGPKAQSEHMSEEEKERPNLNPLIQKTPRQVAFVETPESTKQPVLVEVKEEPALTEFGGRRKSPTVYGDISQQTDRNMVIEEAKESRRAVSLQVPMASRDFFSSSPHYLREDPLRSKDKKNIISTQGAVVEENISTKHFRQAEKFTVNLDDIAKIGQEEAPRPTYSEVIDYNTINFEDYKPQLEEESMPTTIRGGNSKAESDERPGRTPPKKPQLGGVFKSSNAINIKEMQMSIARE